MLKYNLILVGVKGNAEESVCYGGGIVVVSIVVLPDPELYQLVDRSTGQSINQ